MKKHSFVVPANILSTVFLLVSLTQSHFAQAPNHNQSQKDIAISEPKPIGNYNIKIPPGIPETTATPQAGAVSGFGDRAQSRDRNGPRRENLQAINVAGKHISALIGGFEQGAGFGFGIELSTADSIPGIEFRAKALTSTKFYRRFELQAFFPKIGDDKTHIDLWFNYQKRTRDNFFNIGPRSPDEPETNVASDHRSYNVTFYRDFAKGVQAGVYAQLANTNAFRGEDDKDIPIDSIFSGNPNVMPVTRFLPGLNVNAKLFTYGAYAEVDLRNNDRGLPKGAYFYIRGASFEGLENDVFSDFGWNEVELDGRVYIPVASDLTSLALRAYSEWKTPKGNSQIPFFHQAWIGGRSYNRGFKNYRFRGNKSLLFSVEPRQTVWKQEDTKGVDIFVFGDGGQVWGDNRSQTNPQVLANDKFVSSNWRFGVGGGIQYRWNRSTAFRVEMGNSNEGSRVFFSVTRGF